MKKRILAALMAGAVMVSMTACNQDTTPNNGGDNTTTTAGGNSADTTTAAQTEQPAAPVELYVTTTYAGEDTNAQNYKDAVAEWEAATGNTVVDSSATSDETFKTRVITDFETGSEPDVLFFFNGADSDPFVSSGKVVSIDEIRAEYPEYATNMDDGRIVAGVDGKKYAVPANGYWEAMFVNMSVLNAAGVAKPGTNYTMDDFKADCAKIKEAGYTPIAASLSTIPHYWWEFAIFNNQSPATHLQVPASVDDELGKQWVQGMNDIKELYELGCFPDNTLSATDDETFAAFCDGKSAFLIDGSWKVGGIVGACQSDPNDPSTLDQSKLDNFDVTFVPGKGNRKATDLIGGISSGWYITRKAWDDPAKKAAAVSFIESITTDEKIIKFAAHGSTALKSVPEVDTSTFNSLQIKAMQMISKSTSFTGAVQDIFAGDCRVSTFDGMPEIVTGTVTAEDAVKQGLEAYAAQ